MWEYGIWDQRGDWDGEEDSNLVGDFNCWNCGKPVTYSARSENDGFCPHCDSEIELEDEEENE